MGLIASTVAGRVTSVWAGNAEAAPLALAALAHGPITGFEDRSTPQRRAQSGPSGLLFTPRATTAAPPGERRLLRNSEWLLSLAGVMPGSVTHGTPMRVATARLNVRTRPSAHSAVVARLQHQHHDTVQVLEARGGWRRITGGGPRDGGWVAALLIAPPSVRAYGCE